MGIKLGDISPLAGAITGEGMGSMMTLPGLLMRDRNRRDAEEQQAAQAEKTAAQKAAGAASGYKAGGTVAAKGWGKARGGRGCKVR